MDDHHLRNITKLKKAKKEKKKKKTFGFRGYLTWDVANFSKILYKIFYFHTLKIAK